MSSYEQYTEMDKPEGYLWLTDEYKKLQQQIERLQEQLKEANNVIISVAVMPRFPVNPELCRQYLKKWGVK